MHDILRTLGLNGIIPVVAIDNAINAVPLARALEEGGLPCIEITFRTAAAADAIAAIAKECPGMLAGAGTVLTIDQVKAARDNGARYIVSPGLNRRVVEYCLSKTIPITPGVSTPSDVEVALDLGLEVVKFFPAEAAGGVKFLSALSGPYRQIRFIPTGGIDEKNLLSYLRLPRVHACGGSWMVKPEMINAGKFDEIRAITASAVSMMLGFELRYVGINCSDADAALRQSSAVAELLRVPLKQGNSSNFVGTGLEFLKGSGRGQHGHIAIGTNFIDRGVAYLERRGARMIPDSKVEKDGRLMAVYLDMDIAGFAIHLVQV